MISHTRVRNVSGLQIKKYRELRGWNQTELASKCQLVGWNVTRDIVATIEGRTRWIGDFELVILSKVLGVPLVDLLPDRISWAELGIAKDSQK